MCFIVILLLFELQPSNTQFPNHIDLQKIGDVDVNGEKYNLLKPTQHTITDYFKNFMLGEIRRYLNERVYIDDNGFRHDWAYFDKNLRKHYIIKDSTTLKEIKLTDQKDNKAIEDKTQSKDKVRKKPRRKKKIIDEEEKKEPLKEDSLRDGGRTVARTTFFCPFFGVITMSSYLD